MTEYPYILFNKSPEQLRRLGACGGRAYGRNQRARRARVPTPRPAVPPRAVPRETAAEAIHVLDAQFPWLASAEQPVSRHPAWHPRSPRPDVSKPYHLILNTGLDHTARPQQAAQEIAKPAERHPAAPRQLGPPSAESVLNAPSRHAVAIPDHPRTEVASTHPPLKLH